MLIKRLDQLADVSLNSACLKCFSTKENADAANNGAGSNNEMRHL